MELTKREFEAILDDKLEKLGDKLEYRLEQKLEQKLEAKLDQKLDQKLSKFATKDDLKHFATKKDMQNQTAELKKFAEEQTDQLARIIAVSISIPMEKGFKKVHQRLDHHESRIRS